jgi:alpha-beta hydrolase superfamily lysophospholipase
MPPVVIGSHGLFANAASPKQIALAEKCNALGLAFFRFDHRGCGKSEGRFEAVTSLGARCTDFLDAVSLMRHSPDTGTRMGAFGSSMGGATVLSAAGTVPLDAIVTVAAPISSKPVLSAAKQDQRLGAHPVSFYQKNLNFDISDRLPSVSRILMFHGDADEVVPVSSAHDIFAKVAHPKKLVIQKNGDHPMSDPRLQADFIRDAANWFKKWLIP